MPLRAETHPRRTDKSNNAREEARAVERRVHVHRLVNVNVTEHLTPLDGRRATDIHEIPSALHLVNCCGRSLPLRRGENCLRATRSVEHPCDPRGDQPTRVVPIVAVVERESADRISIATLQVAETVFSLLPRVWRLSPPNRAPRAIQELEQPVRG